MMPPEEKVTPNPDQPPDQPARQRILEALDTTMLVEAAAGTGKTTSLIGRMVALIREGRCAIDTLAAVTFTRNAAAELRSRFQLALECAVESAEVDSPARSRLQQAISHVDRCFLGTIHSFCARLLRERPVEAGVDLAFEELDDATDLRIRREAWDDYVAELHAQADPLLAELEALGLQLGQLREAFFAFAQYPDVPAWPAPAVELPDLTGPAAALEEYARHMQRATAGVADAGRDALIPLYRRVSRMVRQADLTRPAQLMEILELCREDPEIVQKCWPGERDQALAELARWNTFCQTVAVPLVRTWHACRYGVVLRAITPAREVYHRHRRLAGGLNFQDLLLRAAELLRSRPAIRRYFRKRFTHLLVDEFQDTDPIQAEVMLLLTADDPAERDWRQCRPVPGSLFVVGDPKQSIYRFRRADIVTYNQVKEIIRQSGGEVVRLTANFRSVESIITWVNSTFEKVFPEVDSDVSPAHVAMQPGRAGHESPHPTGVHVLDVPSQGKTDDPVREFESNVLAWTIHRAVAAAGGEAQTGNAPPAAQPNDFLIVTRGKKRMTLYGEKLQQLGIPHEITGGATLNEVPELALLHTCLRAATDPNNAVAVVAALRSPLFGISDTALYAFKHAGGRFSIQASVPDELDDPESAALGDALRRLRLYERWLAEMPPVPACERIAADLGLFVRAAAAEGGSMRAGSLAKALELVRARQPELPSLADVVAYLGRLVEPEVDEDRHDGQTAHPPEQKPVRIMNLHKVKGLEAPVVFLADPTGDTSYPVALHVDRTTDPPQGYLAVYGERRGRGEGSLLACPLEWEALTAREEQFQAAEQHRLHYVAATRAGSRLVITRRTGYANRNPWRFFSEHISNCDPIDQPPRPEPRSTEPLVIDPAEVQAAADSIEERWSVLLRPSYAIIEAKKASVPGASPAAAAPYRRDDRSDWGTVIHELLKVEMTRPGGDLKALAAELLAANDLPADRADRAVAIVEAVRESDLWQRARASTQCLVEIPFDCPKLDGPDAGDPRVVRGVIDLAFREGPGWVIVDYKTHEGPGGRRLKLKEVEELARQYGPQVQAYAEAWNRITREPVVETGLMFTHAGTYFALDLP